MYYKPHYNHYNHPAQPKLPTISNPITASHPQLSSRHHSLSPNTRKRRTVNNQPAPSSTSDNTLSSSPDHIYTHTTLVYLTHGNRYTHTHTARKRGPRASLPFSSSRFLKSGAGGGDPFSRGSAHSRGISPTAYVRHKARANYNDNGVRALGKRRARARVCSGFLEVYTRVCVWIWERIRGFLGRKGKFSAWFRWSALRW